MGDALLWLGRYDEACVVRQALALRPDFIDVLLNKGFALFHLRALTMAAELSAVPELEPGNAKAAWQLAHVELLCGDYAAGWARREARWNMPDFSVDYPRFAEPKWLGQEPISQGKPSCSRTMKASAIRSSSRAICRMVAARGARSSWSRARRCGR